MEYYYLSGLPKEQKDLYGLMSAEKYFYLNQLTNVQIQYPYKNNFDLKIS
jgi:hypothetical protein